MEDFANEERRFRPSSSVCVRVRAGPSSQTSPNHHHLSSKRTPSPPRERTITITRGSDGRGRVGVAGASEDQVCAVLAAWWPPGRFTPSRTCPIRVKVRA